MPPLGLMACQKWTEQESRLIVITNVFNMVLQPTLVRRIAQQMKDQYSSLDQRNNLKQQTRENHVHKDLKFTYNYGSVNGNHKVRNKNQWNYSLKDENDLAKLYMKPFMVHFEEISDGAFDLSASLSVIGNCSAFSQELQQAAHLVRRKVRNQWAHSNLEEWTEEMFAESLAYIIDLVEKLKTTDEDKKSVLSAIDKYKKEGRLCNFSYRFKVKFLTRVKVKKMCFLILYRVSQK